MKILIYRYLSMSMVVNRQPEVVLSYKKIIELKNYVPVGACSLCRLVEGANNGKPVLETDWDKCYNSGGQLPQTSRNEVRWAGEGQKPGAFINPRVIPTCIAFWPGEKELNLPIKHTTLEPYYNQLFLNLG
jgi:hypothetical protein